MTGTTVIDAICSPTGTKLTTILSHDTEWSGSGYGLRAMRAGRQANVTIIEQPSSRPGSNKEKNA